MEDKPLEGKTIAIMVGNGFDEFSFTESQKLSTKFGASFLVVSKSSGLVNGWYKGNWGHFFPVDFDLANTLAVDYHGLIIPGGIRSINEMADDPHAKRILKAFLRAQMPVALIGDALKLLLISEDAKGRSVTGVPEFEDLLTESDAKSCDEKVVVDDNLVTGRASDSIHETFKEFMELVVKYDGEIIEAA